MEEGCQNMPRHKPGRKEIPVEEQKNVEDQQDTQACKSSCPKSQGESCLVSS